MEVGKIKDVSTSISKLLFGWTCTTGLGAASEKADMVGVDTQIQRPRVTFPPGYTHVPEFVHAELLFGTVTYEYFR